MILIADSGSTKCDWIVFNVNQSNIQSRIRTKGINPSILKKKAIHKTIRSSKELIACKEEISFIYFFGAGCNNEKSKEKIQSVLLHYYSNAKKIEIQEDIMLAVLSASIEPSVVCILGTGSNCCFFDGNKIEKRITSMGYLLMDEGSGNHLGKQLLKAYYFNELPNDLKFSFEKEFNLNSDKVLSKLYNSKTPNKYLAKYARFLFTNIENSYVQELVASCVSEFINKQLITYKEELEKKPLYFIGSVAYHAKKIINEELAKNNLKPVTLFIRRPLTMFIQKIQNNPKLLEKSFS
ncbi:BadF/BadG/BcrA/BcrD ATPase family protein [Tenacibaculum sp. SDUM215027]|uniref:BadF/BadG/BcrA/BcrD ATPase family protein n=1 Tax=Tenacibaculum sp. SDUM215027 TaxID=3422596 RepID=UPI003D321C22